MTTAAPYIQSSDTSRAAAESIRPSAANLREKVLGAITLAGMTGMSDEDIANFTGMNPSTARPRRCELAEVGLIVDLGERRKTASGRSCVVWFAKSVLP